jgi:hypothetical protein
MDGGVLVCGGVWDKAVVVEVDVRQEEQQEEERGGGKGGRL